MEEFKNVALKERKQMVEATLRGNYLIPGVT